MLMCFIMNKYCFLWFGAYKVLKKKLQDLNLNIKLYKYKEFYQYPFINNIYSA